MKTKVAVGIIVALVAGAAIYDWDLPPGDGSNDKIVYLAPTPSPGQLPEMAPPPETFKDTSMLRAPAGAKVAIYEFDDLECPVCARAVPIIDQTVAHYKIPLIHRDYPLTEIHVWSFDAAVTARYLQDKVSPGVADEFRRDIFAHQAEIGNKDDLDRFTKGWFAAHGQAMPFAMDSRCTDEVKADRALGDRIGVGRHGTPCIFVVTQHGWTLVPDVNQLSEAVDAALAQSSAAVEVPRKDERKA
jgi:protein-disulfide isomerase